MLCQLYNFSICDHQYLRANADKDYCKFIVAADPQATGSKSGESEGGLITPVVRGGVWAIKCQTIQVPYIPRTLSRALQQTVPMVIAAQVTGDA